MLRTTVMLPYNLKEKAESKAKELHVSLGELIREGLERILINDHEEDSFISDTEVYEGGKEKDLAKNHDKYLYGE